MSDTFVETYFLTEHEEAFTEPEEWKAKVEELELEGQKSLMEGEAKSPIPFMLIEKDMEAIFSTVCPRTQNIEDYSSQPIPMEALSTVGLAVKENYFERIEVWSNEKDPDPLIVGVAKIDGNMTKFLMARWGREKKTLEDLKKRAMELWIPKAINKLKSEIKENEGKLDRIQELAEMHFNGEYVGVYV